MESHNTTIDGRRIHYLEGGDPGSPPVVLVHGYPASCHLWRHCTPPLEEVFHVFAPDLPGHGRSAKPLDVEYDLEFFVSFLGAFLDHVGVDQCHLVAHDLGGMAGLGFAARHPERVSRFVVMDTAPYVPWPLLNRLVVALARSPLFGRGLASRRGLSRALRWFTVHDPSVITDEVVELYLEPWRTDPAGRAALRRVISAPADRWAVPPQSFASITMPTLVLWAERDRVLPPRLARRLQADLPNASLSIVPGCGHFLQEERPDEVSSRILGFLSAA